LFIKVSEQLLRLTDVIIIYFCIRAKNKIEYMKRYTLFLFIISNVFLLNAQKAEYSFMNSRIADFDEYKNIPDSVVAFEPDGNKTSRIKYVRTPDNMGFTEEESEWDKTQENWVGTLRRTHKFDSYGNRTFDLQEYWNGSQWVGSAKIIYGYNQQGMMTLHESYFWDAGTGEWVGTSKSVMLYYAGSLIALSEGYSWDFTKKDWIGIHKIANEYDDYSHKIRSESSRWNNEKEDWEVFSLILNEYLAGTDFVVWEENYSRDEERGILYLSNREKTTFGQNGKPEATLSYQRESPEGNEYLSGKVQYFYNEANMLAGEEIFYSYGEEELIPYSKYEYTSDEENRPLENIFYTWRNNDWQYNQKTTYTYSTEAGDSFVEEILYTWNSTSFNWIYSSRNLTGKDSFGNSILNESYRWNNSLKRWDGQNYNVNKYNAANRKTLSVNYNWNNVTGSWIGKTKEEIFFNNDTVLSRSVNYKWNEANSDWIGTSRYDYEYLDGGLLQVVTGFVWNIPTDDWIYSNRTEKLFDENRNMLTSSYSYWDKVKSRWQISSDYKNEYDTKGRIIYNEFYSYNRNTEELTLVDYRFYYYSHFSISENELHFVAKGETLSVTITTDTEWTIISNAEWLDITPASGERNSLVSIVAVPNTTEEIRTTIIEIRPISVTLPGPYSITITQDAGEAVPPIPVNYTVTILPVEGATTYPLAGEVTVKEHESFRLDISVDKEYDPSEIALRINNDVVTVTPIPGTMNYMYYLQNVTSDLEMEVIGLKQFPPVSNVNPEENIRLYTQDGTVYIDTPAPAKVNIYTTTGQIIASKNIPDGLSSFSLSSGIYVVKIDEKVYKVIVK